MKALLLLAALSLSAAAPAPAPPKSATIKTKDGWTLDALYRPAKPGRPVLVLGHGVGAGKGEWTRLAEALEAKGVGTLAIDLRGHGGSVRGPEGPREWTTLDARQEWPLLREDFLASARWLEGQGVPAAKIAFGGASIGANIASRAATERKATPFLLLLSASNNYRGVMLASRAGLPTLAVASRQDAYAFEGSRRLAARPGVKLVEAPAGHGAPMLDDEKTLKSVVDWLVGR